MPKGKISFTETDGGNPGPIIFEVSYDAVEDPEAGSIEIDGHGSVVGNKIAVCGCGKTGRADRTCDGSHLS